MTRHYFPMRLSIYQTSSLARLESPLQNMAHLGSTPRFVEAMRPLIVDVLGFLASWILAPTHHDTTASSASQSFHTFADAQWHVQLAKTLFASFRETRLAYFVSGCSSAVGKYGSRKRICARDARSSHAHGKVRCRRY